jgi:hypothetical protein
MGQREVKIRLAGQMSIFNAEAIKMGKGKTHIND